MLAARQPEKYVEDHANNNWFQVKKQYEAGELKYKGDGKKSEEAVPEYGMDALLAYRSKIVTEPLLEEVKPLANEHERQTRRQIWNDRPPKKPLSDNAPEAVERDRFIGQAPPLVADAPGSTKPKSDIDVNTSGGGSEFAVYWLNKEFRKRYGHGPRALSMT